MQWQVSVFILCFCVFFSLSLEFRTLNNIESSASVL